MTSRTPWITTAFTLLLLLTFMGIEPVRSWAIYWLMRSGSALITVTADGLGITLATDCSATTALGAPCFDTDDFVFYIGDGSAAELIGPSPNPALQNVLTQGRTCTDCTSITNAMRIGGSGTSYVGLYNDATLGPIIGAFDSSNNPRTQHFAIYDGDPQVTTVGNGAGTQQTCRTMSDAGLQTFSATESCGVSDGVRSPIAANTGATLTVTAAMSGRVIGNTDADAIEFDLPAVAAGLKYCFLDEAGGAMTIDPNGSQVITFDGVAASGGEAIVSTAGIGTMACFLANSGGTAWFGWTQFGTFAEATP